LIYNIQGKENTFETVNTEHKNKLHTLGIIQIFEMKKPNKFAEFKVKAP